MGVWFDRFSRDRIGVALFANWSPFKFVIKAIAPDGNIENLLDQFNQRLKDFKELILFIETCALYISRIVVGNK